MAEPDEGPSPRACRSARFRPAMTALAGGVAAATLAAAALPLPSPKLVWNATPSSPKGLYAVVAEAEDSRGDLVVARAPGRGAALAEARGYLRRGVPLVKTVVAVRGDRVCADGGAIVVNARWLAWRLRADRQGRPLPAWHGCRDLGQGDVLLLGLADASSFDGRYFGPTRASDILGRARRLWPT